MSRLALFASLATVLAGCPSDSSTGSSTGGLPTLTLAASNACGKNILPLMPRETFVAGEAPSIDVTVRGIDPNNSSGTLTGGTEVEIFVANVDAEGVTQVPDGQGGWFTSSFQAPELPDRNKSSGLKFAGFIARDAFFCVEPGDHILHARVFERDADGNPVYQYKPGGSGEPIAVTTLRDRGFPIRCVPIPVYENECGPLPGDGFMPDMAVDASDASDAEASIDMEILPSWALEYIPLEPGQEIIGIRGAAGGRPFQVELTFQVKELDLPVPGAEVEFKLPDTHPPNVAIDPSAGKVTTDASGVARVTVIAGGTPGVVNVSARAQRDFEGDTPEGGCASAEECGGDTNCDDGACDVCVDEVCYQRQFQDSTSQVIVIRGGIPSHRGFQFVCEHPVLPAFSTRRAPENRNEQDIWVVPNEPGTDCFVQVADRVNGRVDTDTQVFFLSEAGTVDQASAIDEGGRAATHLRIGLPPPKDVEPFDYEVAAGYEGPYNPRDGVVRMVAVTRGEEDFLDVDGDKVWNEAVDLQHPWHQLSDPFIDYDDDGEFDDGAEEWRDGDDSGDFTFANDEWDADLEIWTSVSVLWVGDLFFPAQEDGPAIPCPGVTYSCVNDPSAPGTCRENDVDAVNRPPSIVGEGGAFLVHARFADINGNCLDGRQQGVISIAIDGEWNIGGAAEDERFRCFQDGLPIAGTTTWRIRTNLVDDGESFTDEVNDMTIEAEWERILGEDDGISCTIPVRVTVGNPPPPPQPGN